MKMCTHSRLMEVVRIKQGSMIVVSCYNSDNTKPVL